jgi:hypothetical protein
MYIPCSNLAVHAWCIMLHQMRHRASLLTSVLHRTHLRLSTATHLHVCMDQQDEGVLQQQHASIAGTLARLPGTLSIARFRVGEDQAMECALPCHTMRICYLASAPDGHELVHRRAYTGLQDAAPGGKPASIMSCSTASADSTLPSCAARPSRLQMTARRDTLSCWAMPFCQ